ncbi:succinyl-diaminopimelate desuccinylase [Chryseomicrobium aureum]|uniref:dipeptidase PepV n=1 Tax=Chryseomicrobium aureum TaxID=1441723 RepID=UPI00195AEDD0|nr:dipeptidase PepV [Chryseomicrobium aureum]MBM7706900.1 succinyl-diaminopimelate desuccinylase [Chryseomicrobium aureum]
MNWFELATARKDELLKELQQLISIESVLDESAATEDAPFGPKPLEALEYLLHLGAEQGMTTKNVANVAGHIEMGQGDELIGVLGHVDVVPAGDGWSVPPFEGRIVGSKMIGRGTIDDKGPTMAAWMAMKLVKDSGIPLERRVRLIIGTDEESGFRCVRRYFETEEMPTLGFAPDADFPIINAEKGIAGIELSQSSTNEASSLVFFQSGERTNMVPDEANALLELPLSELEASFQKFLLANNLKGKAQNVNGKTSLIVSGKSSHAMEPDNGINAAVKLAEFLVTLNIGGQGAKFVKTLVDAFGSDSRGKTFDGYFSDEMSGETTYNAGVLHFVREEGFTIKVSMRYSVSAPFEELVEKITDYFKQNKVDVRVSSNSGPHYVDASDELIQTLSTVYERQTGEKAELLAIGGGTYARVLKKGVAFGMVFPGEADVAHQADEFVDIKNLLKATAIYADALAELAGKKD